MLGLSDDRSDTSSYGSLSVITLSLLKKKEDYFTCKVRFFKFFFYLKEVKSCKTLHFENGSCISLLIEKQC